MSRLEALRDTLPAWAERAGAARDSLWAIVLAGGQGIRLRALTRRLYGDERPKQYAALVGSRSLLRQTLDRVALTIPAEHTLVVTLRDHARYLAAEFTASPPPRMLVQPEDRGTAAGVLFAAHRIRWWDPEATVVVCPSDHFILEESAFMDHVADVAAVVSRHPDWMVLLGARPTEPETEYGWIEPGEPLPWSTGRALRRVRGFWEKPSAEMARACLAGGCLWNTFVFVAKVSTLVDAGRRFLPDLHDLLAWIAPFADTTDEAWAIEQAYALASSANFSRSILECCPSSLAVSRLPDLTWCDWGTPERVLRSLRQVGIEPPWVGAEESWIPLGGSR